MTQSTSFIHAGEPCPECRPVRLPDGRHAGCWRHGTLLLSQHRAKHLLQRPPALAFHADLLREQRTGLQEIMAVDRDAGTWRAIRIEDFERHAFPVSRGYGPQHACPLSRWRILGGTRPTASLQLAFGL